MKTLICFLIMFLLVPGICDAQTRFSKYVIGKAGERVPGFCVSSLDLDPDKRYTCI
jgi:hypothetical protein